MSRLRGSRLLEEGPSRSSSSRALICLTGVRGEKVRFDWVRGMGCLGGVRVLDETEVAGREEDDAALTGLIESMEETEEESA